MEQVLSLSARPATFDGLVGQQKTVESIRKRFARKRMPKAWLFHGPLGCGKTTIARILALSLQCEHQETFGVPCMECRRLKSQFMTMEIPAADVGTVNLKEMLAPSYLTPMGVSARRIFILDEPQGMHINSQRYLLKLFEDTPDTSVFMICTTEPHKLIDTLRSRCAAYELRGLNVDEILKLVTRLLKKAGSDLPADRLTDALIERGFNYPRWIAQATERYVIDGGEVNDAATVDAAQSVNVEALVLATTKGDWPAALTLLGKSDPSEARAIRLGVLRYLRGIILQSEDVSDRTRVVADGILELSALQNAEDVVIHASVAATLFKIVDRFKRYKH